MHVYAFGSLCRGEIRPDSDVDLLAIVDGYDSRFDQYVFSIYSYARLAELWNEGNPFGWHLFLESRLIYSADGSDFLQELGSPQKYGRCNDDCARFLKLFKEARESLNRQQSTVVYDLSMIFLAIRNFASCYSLGVHGHPNFTRHSALSLGMRALGVPTEAYGVLERARILCTRGVGPSLTREDIVVAASALDDVEGWMINLMKEVSRG